MQEIKQKLIFAVVGIAVGIGVGGLIWGSGPEKVEVEKLVQSSITVVETRDVVVREIVTAERAQVIETQQPDGTVVIDSRYYGLGIDRTMAVSEAVHASASETVHTKEASTQRMNPNHIGLTAIAQWDNLMGFDYKSDWMLTYSRSFGDSPFTGTLSAGPRYVGVGLGFSF